MYRWAYQSISQCRHGGTIFLIEWNLLFPKKGDCMQQIKNLDDKNDCERFFRSSWYKTLTSVDGEFLMRTLQKEVAA